MCWTEASRFLLTGSRMCDAEIDERIDLVGLVEDGVDAELRATLADVRRGVIAQDDHFLACAPSGAFLQHTQATSLPEKKVDDRQFPLVFVSPEPFPCLVLALRMADRYQTGKFLERPNEVLADGEVVFDDVGFQVEIRAGTR